LGKHIAFTSSIKKETFVGLNSLAYFFKRVNDDKKKFWRTGWGCDENQQHVHEILKSRVQIPLPSINLKASLESSECHQNVGSYHEV